MRDRPTLLRLGIEGKGRAAGELRDNGVRTAEDLLVADRNLGLPGKVTVPELHAERQPTAHRALLSGLRSDPQIEP